MRLRARDLYEWIVVGSEAGAITASNGIVITPDYAAQECASRGFHRGVLGRRCRPAAGEAAARLDQEVPERRRPYRQRGGWRLLSGARRTARQSSIDPALAKPAGLLGSLPASGSGALDLCDRPDALYLRRRDRRLRHDARHPRQPSRRGHGAAGRRMVRA